MPGRRATRNRRSQDLSFCKLIIYTAANVYCASGRAKDEPPSPTFARDALIQDPPAIESHRESPSSEDSHQPPPASVVPQFQTFGADPSTYDDPTIYHLREILPSMPEAEKQDVLGVTTYPHDDLHDLTPGTPPDRDFTNAKPQHQVTATTFATYLEPFIRDITEEDLAFLRERVSNTTLITTTLLTKVRVIGSTLLLCQDEARNHTKRCGRRKMAISRPIMNKRLEKEQH